ncbi:hypothetical protein JXQ70_20690 [bacterium]|nr:hypothetical protein [bacterium]
MVFQFSASDTDTRNYSDPDDEDNERFSEFMPHRKKEKNQKKGKDKKKMEHEFGPNKKSRKNKGGFRAERKMKWTDEN